MKNRFYIMLFVIISMLCSCNDIFESDLSKKDLTLVLPSDSITTNTYSVSFMWNGVEDALHYKMQIVSPGFDNIQKFVLDSNVTGTTFTYTLSPGTYQWRVRAENGSSQTDYQTRTIIVKKGSLSQQQVVLSSPSNLAGFGTSSVLFTWQAIFGTTNYILEVDTVTGDFNKISKSTSNTKYSLSLSEGNYKWRVKATNDTATSQYSDERTFMIDKTAPSIVESFKAIPDASVSGPIVLSWLPVTDNLSGIKGYKVFIYKTTSKDTLLIPKFDPLIVTSPAANFTYSTAGTSIMYRVKAIDVAGNESDYSNRQYFTTK